MIVFSLIYCLVLMKFRQQILYQTANHSINFKKYLMMYGNFEKLL